MRQSLILILALAGMLAAIWLGVQMTATPPFCATESRGGIARLMACVEKERAP